MQWFRSSLLAANTTPSSEGVVSSPVPMASTTLTATVEQYSDFTNFSTLLIETAINEMVAQGSEDMSYRAAFTTDLIVRAEVDSLTAALRTTQLAYLSGLDIKNATARLAGVNVQPRDGGDWLMIAHPYVIYDLQADNSPGGWLDSKKYAEPSALLSGEVGRYHGTTVLQTTNVGTSGIAPNVLYNTYIFGRGGLGIVNLAGRGPSKVMDPKRQSFNINVIKGGPSPADPEGQIGAYVSYFFVFTAKVLDPVTPRYVIIQADSGVV